MNIKRRISFTKGLTEELAKRVNRVDDLVTNFSTVDGTAGFNDKYVGANALRALNLLNVKYADIVDIVDVDGTAAYDNKFINANQIKELKDLIDASATGLVFKGSFDIGTETVMPLSPKVGDFYKIINSVSADTSVTIDGLHLTQNDSLFRGTASWIKIDNTESIDILRDADVSTAADLTVDPTKLTDRITVKNAIDSAVALVTVKFINEQVTLTGDTATLSHTPLNGVIFLGIASINNTDGTFDQVECSVVVKALTVAADVAGEYTGKVATVTYAYVV